MKTGSASKDLTEGGGALGLAERVPVSDWSRPRRWPVHKRRRRRKGLLPRVMLIGGMGCLGLLFVASHARVASLEREYKALRQKVETRHAENAFLQVAMDDLSRPERLVREAGRMGLRTPKREVEIVALPANDTMSTADASGSVRHPSETGRRDIITVTAMHVGAWAEALKGTPVHASSLGPSR